MLRCKISSVYRLQGGDRQKWGFFYFILFYFFAYKPSIKSSWRAIRMRSAVAGEFIVKWPVKPDSVLAEEIASLIAKKTLDARNKGGSPIACKIKELYLIIQLKLLNKKSNTLEE